MRVLDLPEANLAEALNAALESARCPVVARMDADDTCSPERFAVQVERLAREPSLAGVGCAYEVVDPAGRVLHTVRPPTEGGRLRWSLLLANCLAHGSMMLRREAVLRCETGSGRRGYDPSCVRAQDYELWLRLSRGEGLAAVPDVLYRHRLRSGEDPTRVTAEQARTGARAMMREWAALPGSGRRAEIEAALATGSTAGIGVEAAIEQVARILDEEGPTREGLMALLWARAILPQWPRRAMESSRRARLREVGAAMRAAGAARAWLWGAGDHTRWVLENSNDLGVLVAGIVDDAPKGDRFGLGVRGPEDLCAGEHVLISSDWHEEAIWAASESHRRRGVLVHRLYG